VSGGLRKSLIGAWALLSDQEVPVDGGEPFEPLDPNPQGIIRYTPDGYMSAQLAKPDRPHFTSGDWFTGSTGDYVAAASTYIAYTGPSHVDEEARTLAHSMFVSLFPDWTGQTQPRRVHLKGDELHLGTVSPTQSSGRTVNSVLR